MKETNRGYKKLIVYQKAKELLLLVYEVTKTFPAEKKFVLIPQMRRSALSVPANIVEGYAKKSRRGFSRFLDISIGSLTELELYIEISFDLKYINSIIFRKINFLLLEVKKILYSFQKSLRRERS